MSPDSSSSSRRSDDGRSLRSILSLAAGAAALQTAAPAEAAIIVTELATPAVVGFGGAAVPSAGFDLPGLSTKKIVFEASTRGAGLAYVVQARFSDTIALDANDLLGLQPNSRSPATYAGSLVAFRTGYGPSWNASPDRTNANPLAVVVQASRIKTTIGTSPPAYSTVFKGAGPGSFTGKYLLFTFMNSDVGQVNYGWIHLASATREISPDGKTLTSMSVTFDRWAYQDDGSTINAGQTVAVPEPSTTASLAMGGALVAGAAGLRAWRKRR